MKGRYEITEAAFMNYHHSQYGKNKQRTMTILDREIAQGIEMEKLQIFVHRTLGVEMSALSAMDTVKFFQLVNEADKVQRQQMKNNKK